MEENGRQPQQNGIDQFYGEFIKCARDRFNLNNCLDYEQLFPRNNMRILRNKKRQIDLFKFENSKAIFLFLYQDTLVLRYWCDDSQSTIRDRVIISRMINNELPWENAQLVIPLGRDKKHSSEHNVYDCILWEEDHLDWNRIFNDRNRQHRVAEHAVEFFLFLIRAGIRFQC